jgi:hypothetical protein
MRAAGLRFSILRTDRFAEAYRLYVSHGYQDMPVRATCLARWETAHQPTRLRLQPAPGGDSDGIEALVQSVAAGSLGFAWSAPPPAPPGGALDLETVRILCRNHEPVGYLSTRRYDTLTRVTVHALVPGADAAEAVAAITSEETCAYVQVIVSRPAEIASLRAAGYQVTHPDRLAFLLKPLGAGVSHDDARRLFGIGTDRFLISWLDTT